MSLDKCEVCYQIIGNENDSSCYMFECGHKIHVLCFHSESVECEYDIERNLISCSICKKKTNFLLKKTIYFLRLIRLFFNCIKYEK